MELLKIYLIGSNFGNRKNVLNHSTQLQSRVSCESVSLIPRLKEQQKLERELEEWRLEQPYATDPEWSIRLGMSVY